MVKIYTLVLMALLLPSLHAFAGEETPHEAVQAIIELYQARDYETLIRERYTERHKAEALGKMRELTDKFAQRLAGEDTLEKVISAYSECLKVDPVITDNPYRQVTETGKVAEFPLEHGSFKLYQQKTGLWGFHM
jgi:hypothetical protein